MAGEAMTSYKRLASLLSEKRDKPYSVTIRPFEESFFFCSFKPFGIPRIWAV